ncbi:MAG: tRNA pseudouridine(13) synthase TruD, partial [Candidatus Eisenbacteria bacterium]|nr:tRNA pseudouridine(13) synthase TruD [Candidatus Eisenbacteria bacterium]
MNLIERATVPLPLLTATVPGTGGRIRMEPEDFVVAEIPAYEPAGEGEHLFLEIEKRGRTTDDVRRALAKRIGARQDDIGVAGLKDKHAVTTQWMSVPGKLLSEMDATGLGLDGVRVLQARRHRNKLRTGHLRGNRFTITIRGVSEDAHAHARTCVARIIEEGVPNYYGEQRFGHRGETVTLGLS